MKSKAMPQTPRSRRAMLYPVLSFGIILLWLLARSQVDSILHGHPTITFYPVMIIAGIRDAWPVAAIMGCVMVYVHATLRDGTDQMHYTPIGVASLIIQIGMLVFGTVFFSASAQHLQTLSTADHTYQLAQGDINLIGGFGAYVVMECDPFGVICKNIQTYEAYSMCFREGGQIAIDPETGTVVLQVGEETYTDSEGGTSFCAPLKHGLDR